MQEEIEALDIPQSYNVEVGLRALLEPLQPRLQNIDDNPASDMTAQLTQTTEHGAEVESPKNWGPLPTPEPSIRGNTASSQQEAGDD